MAKRRTIIEISAAAVVLFAAGATFGYSFLISKNIKNTAVDSKAASAMPPIPTTNYAIPSGAIYMSPTGNDTNNGSSSAPVKTLAKAHSLAPSGGTVVVKGGTYRDGKLTATKPIIFQAAPGEQPWFDGTDVVTGWQVSGSTWFIDGWYTPDFCNGQYYNYAYNAQKADNTGPCNHYDMANDPSNPMAGSPQMAFVNGVALKEVTNLAAVTSGTFYYDKTSQRFSIGTNPVGATVELAKRPTAIITIGASSAIKGIGFRKFASNEYNNSTESPVIVSSANTTIENSAFWANAGYGAGISNSQGTIIRSSLFVSNGFNGFTANGHHAGGTVDNMLIENSTFDDNNTEKFGTNCSASCAQAGVKLSHMNGGTIKNNVFSNNYGHGFWCDLYCTNMTITGNVAKNNDRSGIMYEVSSNGIIASNIVTSNTLHGIRVAGPNIKIYNNTVLTSGKIGLWLYDDPRTASGSEIPADTSNVEVVNNIIQGGTDFFSNLQGNQTTGAQLASKVDYNSYYRPTGTPATGFKIGSASAGYAYYASVVAYKNGTGYEAHGQDIANQANPYFTNASAGDYRVRSDSVAYRAGVGLPSDVATAVGVTAGQAVDIGALSWVGKPGGIVTPPTPPADTTKPTTAISSPANNASGKGTIAITGSATDNVAVTKVELLVDGSVKATDSAAPFASFSWDSTTVSDGAHTLVFKAYDAAGNNASSAGVSITISNVAPPPLPVIVSFVANPATITAGSQSTLSWATQNASSCDVNPGGTQGTTMTSWQTPSLTTVGSKTYTLVCYNTAVQSVSKTITITVNAAPTPPSKPTFSVDKTTVQSGGSATFSWASSGATSCVFNPGNIGGAAVVNGKVVTNITATTTYSLVCQNDVGTSQADLITVTVTAAPVPVALPVITSFVADKTNIGRNQSTTLRWTTTGVITSGCRLNPGTDQGPSGSVTTGNLTASTSYTLTCKNSEGKTVSASTSVVVAGKPAPANPTPIVPTVDPTQAAASKVTDTQNGAQVANASVDDEVSGLASLDISNVVDENKVKAIGYIEYYDGEKLVQKVSEPPFALDTKLLKNGSYSITERTYYIDGTQSEVTKVLGVANAEPKVLAAEPALGGKKAGIGIAILSVLVIVGIVAFFTRRVWLSKFLPTKLASSEPVSTISGVSTQQQNQTKESDDPSVTLIRPDKKD